MRRSLEYMGMEVADDGTMTLVCLCDCASITRVELRGVTIETAAGADGVPEFAYTCDGCATSHWINLQVTRP